MARHVINELQASFDVNGGENIYDEEAATAGGGKADSIQKTISAVTDKMRSNLNRMFENQGELDAMGEKSDHLRRTAETFQNSAQRLEK